MPPANASGSLALLGIARICDRNVQHPGLLRKRMPASFSQLWLMESPRFMLLAGQPREAATAALARARGRFGRDPTAVEKEMNDIATSVQTSSENPRGTIITPLPPPSSHFPSRFVLSNSFWVDWRH